MGLQITNDFKREVYRKSSKGVQLVEVEPDEYTRVKDGEKRVRWTGYSPPFEMEGQFGKSVNTRIELLVLEPAKMARQRFDVLVTLKIGPKANLGKIIAAATGAPVAPGARVDIDDHLNSEFWLTTKQSDDGQYINIASCRPLDEDDAEADDGEEDEAPAARGRATATKPADVDDDPPPY